MSYRSFRSSFYFNDTPTTEIYTLSLHDALPIYKLKELRNYVVEPVSGHFSLSVFDKRMKPSNHPLIEDRKSTRLNSSHSQISYAVFCLKKKNHTASLHDLDPPSVHELCVVPSEN